MRVLLIALSIGCASFNAFAQVKVGDTKDGCDKSNAVTFHGKDGKVTVKAGQTVTADLAAPTREIEWFCGGSQEFSSNDAPYDQVRLHRAANGALTWTFFRLPAAPSSGTPPIASKTGDTADACDGGSVVTFQGHNGTVSVNAGQTVIADLPAPTTEIAWFCGGSHEHAANDTPFDQVRVSRAPNGAIRWVFFLKTAAPDPTGVCNKVHAFGRFFFKNETGVSTPLARVQVKLMDENFGPTDTEMARGFTDADGRFDLTGTSNHNQSNCIGAGCKRPDPYVEFVLEEDHRIDVKDPLENSARQHTQTMERTCGDVDFQHQEWSGAQLDPILYFRGQRAYTNFTTLTGDARVPGNGGLVGIEYPTALIADTPYTTWDTIHWQWHGQGKEDFSGLDHEFGHRIRQGADGDTDHFNWDATRFRYLRDHDFTAITNEGFAFNEGWAEYHFTLLHSGASVPNGTWDGPKGDIVEGDVANQLFNLAQACGGFPRMWNTMKEAGNNAFHSIGEFRAEFVRRNPTCGTSRILLPQGGTPQAQPEPTPTAAAMKRQMPASSNPSGPGAPVSVGATELLAPAQRATIENRLLRLDGRKVQARDVAKLRIPADMPAASRLAIERLNAKRAAGAEALHADTAAAYRKAIESLKPGTPESMSDGSYETARQAAQDAFAASVVDARMRYLQAVRDSLAAEKAQTVEPRLVAFIDSLNEKNTQGETELKRIPTSRSMVVKPLAELLPKSFWEATISMPEPAQAVRPVQLRPGN